MSVIFDTLGYANELKSVGFTGKQAEAQARALARVVEDNIATKHDLKELEATLKLELAALKVEIIRWIAGMLVAQAAIVAALVSCSNNARAVGHF